MIAMSEEQVYECLSDAGCGKELITDKTPEEMRTLLSNGDVTITLSMK